jgi:hypothetical protein
MKYPGPRHERPPLPSKSPRQHDVRIPSGPHRYVATVSFFPGTDRLAEIFIGNGRAGSDVDTAARDAAVVVSIALQYGVPLDVLRHALMRDAQGRASGPLGSALDIIASNDGGAA